MGGGFQRICKAYGAIVIRGERFVWDYVADRAVPESEMPLGSERWKASERKRWGTDERVPSDTEGETA